MPEFFIECYESFLPVPYVNCYLNECPAYTGQYPCPIDVCPSTTEELHYRCSIGDLTEDEIEFFEKQSGIQEHPDKNRPYFVLHIAKDVLGTVEQRYKHAGLLSGFEAAVERMNKADVRFACFDILEKMIGFQCLANEIREARQYDTVTLEPTGERDVPSVIVAECMKAPIEESTKVLPILAARKKTKKKASEPTDDTGRTTFTDWLRQPHEPMPDEVLIANKEPVAVKDDSVVEAIGKAAAAMEDSVFRGTRRAMAQFRDPPNEIEDEKVERLVKDGWKWKDAVREVYPDTTDENLDKKVDEVRQRVKRDRKGKV